MKRLLVLSLIGSSILLSSNSAKADWNYWGTISDPDWGDLTGIKFHTIDSASGNSTLRTRKCFTTTTNPDYGTRCKQPDSIKIDQNSGNLLVTESNKEYIYDLGTDTWTDLGTIWSCMLDDISMI